MDRPPLCGLCGSLAAGHGAVLSPRRSGRRGRGLWGPSWRGRPGRPGSGSGSPSRGGEAAPGPSCRWEENLLTSEPAFARAPVDLAGRQKGLVFRAEGCCPRGPGGRGRDRPAGSTRPSGSRERDSQATPCGQSLPTPRSVYRAAFLGSDTRTRLSSASVPRPQERRGGCRGTHGGPATQLPCASGPQVSAARPPSGQQVAPPSRPPASR